MQSALFYPKKVDVARFIFSLDFDEDDAHTPLLIYTHGKDGKQMLHEIKSISKPEVMYKYVLELLPTVDSLCFSICFDADSIDGFENNFIAIYIYHRESFGQEKGNWQIMLIEL